MGGGGTNTIQTADPWGPTQPYLEDIFKRANDYLFGQGGPQYYPGQTRAPWGPDDYAAQNMLRQWAQTTGPQYAGALGTGWKNLLNAPDLKNNPWVKDYANAATQPLYQRLTEEALPAIRSEVLQHGPTTTTRQGIAEGLATGRTAEAAGRTTSQIMSNAYGQGLVASAQALSQAPQVFNTMQMPAQALSALGQAERAYQQGFLDDAMAKWYFEQNQPLKNIEFMSGLLRGWPTSTTTQGPKQNALLSALGVAQTGLGAYNMANNAGLATNSFGAAMAASMNTTLAANAAAATTAADAAIYTSAAADTAFMLEGSTFLEYLAYMMMA